MKTITKIGEVIYKLLEAILLLTIIGIAVCVTIQVCSRVLLYNVSGVSEIVNLLLVLMVYTGMPIAMHDEAFMKLDLLVVRFPEKVQTVLAVLMNIILFAFFLCVAKAALPIIEKQVVATSFLKIPYKIYYIIYAVSSLLTALFVFINTLSIGRKAFEKAHEGGTL